MLPMHPLQMPQRHMRINLRSSDIGMPQQSLNTPQIRPMLYHVRRTAMPKHMRTSLTPPRRSPAHHLPNPLPRQRIPPHTEKHRPLQTVPVPHQPGPTQTQIFFQRLNSTPPQRNNPFFITLTPHLRSPLVQMHILHPQRHNLPHPQPTRIQQLQNRMIPQRQPIRIIAPRRRTRPLQHLRHLTLSQRLRQHLPTRRRLHIHRRVMRNPLIHQQPPIKPPQTTQLPRNRPRLHRMSPQPLHKPAHITLSRTHQQPIPPLNMLGKLLQIPPIRLTTRRSQPLLHPQIRNKLPHYPSIPVYLARSPHRSRLSRAVDPQNPPSQK